MALAGTIDKTVSIISGIPYSEENLSCDILIERLKNSDEFSVSNIEEKENNKFFIDVNYRNENYLLTILIDELIIPELYTVAHKLDDETYNKIMQTSKCVTTLLNFENSILDSYHLQLKILNTMLPDLIGIMDISAQKLLSGTWAKMAAKSCVQPSPDYIFSIQAINDDKNSVWLHTHGLNRCGSPEIEIVNSNTDNYQNHGTVLQTVGKNIVTGKFLPDEKEPFFIGEGVIGTWVNTEEALKNINDDELGGKNSRDEDHINTAVIFIYLSEDDYNNKKYSYISEVDDILENNPLYYLTDEETVRMKGLAFERWNYFVEAMKDSENNGLIKCGLLVDEEFRQEDSANLEHLWFHVKKIKEDSIKCVLINEPYFIKSLKENIEMVLEKSQMTDWIIYTPFAQITPDSVYLLDDRKKFFN